MLNDISQHASIGQALVRTGNLTKFTQSINRLTVSSQERSVCDLTTGRLVDGHCDSIQAIDAFGKFLICSPIARLALITHLLIDHQIRLHSISCIEAGNYDDSTRDPVGYRERGPVSIRGLKPRLQIWSAQEAALDTNRRFNEAVNLVLAIAMPVIRRLGLSDADSSVRERLMASVQ